VDEDATAVQTQSPRFRRRLRWLAVAAVAVLVVVLASGYLFLANAYMPLAEGSGHPELYCASDLLELLDATLECLQAGDQLRIVNGCWQIVVACGRSCQRLTRRFGVPAEGRRSDRSGRERPAGAEQLAVPRFVLARGARQQFRHIPFQVLTGRVLDVILHARASSTSQISGLAKAASGETELPCPVSADVQSREATVLPIRWR